MENSRVSNGVRTYKAMDSPNFDALEHQARQPYRESGQKGDRRLMRRKYNSPDDVSK